MGRATEMKQTMSMLFCHPFYLKATIHHLGEHESKTQIGYVTRKGSHSTV